MALRITYISLARFLHFNKLRTLFKQNHEKRGGEKQEAGSKEWMNIMRQIGLCIFRPNNLEDGSIQWQESIKKSIEGEKPTN
ncbi:hypothetical protein [Parageobacillus thermoglucosidasius]|uniref:hypothetical protein n=1 Tax=Parageobacillus thermoglucosidasius TaxID=1426 RepID=UPI0030C69343